MRVQKALEDLAREFYRLGLIETSPLGKGFQLRVHRESSANPDWPLAPARFLRSKPIAKELAIETAASLKELSSVDGIQFDRVAGVPHSGDPFAAALSDLCSLPPLSLEKETHAIIGEHLPKGARVLLVENVATMGRSTIQTATALRFDGYSVSDVCAVIDWEAGAERRLDGLPYPIKLHSLFKVCELVKFYRDARYVTAAFVDRVTDFSMFLRGLPGY